MIAPCPRIVIAGTHSGTGKTSVTLGIVAALVRRGLRVQTFKVGPDFLDPTYLQLASGRPCYNLDGWMMSGRKYVEELFLRTTLDADIAVIEGVMGLFDGAAPDALSGSTAEIAGWLQAPIVLVAQARGMARSFAALVQGFVCFEPALAIAGVLANRCGGQRHQQWLAQALQAAGLPELLGAIAEGELSQLQSRHLGLVTANADFVPTLAALAGVIERTASIDTILKIAQAAPALASPDRITAEVLPNVRIGLAHDEAFHFYYQDTLDALTSAGCEIVWFSPLYDQMLPEDLDAVYLGGGYPELFAGALSKNKTMLASMLQFAASNRVLYAECGGLMYLSKGIQTKDGQLFPLCGILPAWTRMLEQKKMLGYREVILEHDSLFGPAKTVLRGHEFHYSELAEDPCTGGEWTCGYRLQRPRVESFVKEGFLRNNILASYVHVHLASQPQALNHFVKACRASATPRNEK